MKELLFIPDFVEPIYFLCLWDKIYSFFVAILTETENVVVLFHALNIMYKNKLDVKAKIYLTLQWS